MVGCENNSELTAITRHRPSSPLTYLLTNGLMIGDILDYGCGKGFDVRFLNEMGYNAEGYDTYYAKKRPSKKYDTILCTYVLNVLEPEHEHEIIEDIKSLLVENGTSYITVRRDIKKEGYRKNKAGTTYQRNVHLNYTVLKENSNFCIYIIKKH